MAQGREISQSVLPLEASTAGIYVVVHGRPDRGKLQHFMKEGLRVREERGDFALTELFEKAKNADTPVVVNRILSLAP